MHPAHPAEEGLVLQQRPDPAPARDQQDVTGLDVQAPRRNIDRQRAQHISNPPRFGCLAETKEQALAIASAFLVVTKR